MIFPEKPKKNRFSCHFFAYLTSLNELNEMKWRKILPVDRWMLRSLSGWEMPSSLCFCSQVYGLLDCPMMSLTVNVQCKCMHTIELQMQRFSFCGPFAFSSNFRSMTNDVKCQRYSNKCVTHFESTVLNIHKKMITTKVAILIVLLVLSYI